MDRKFVDTLQIEVHAGKGGNGCISYEVLSPGRKRVRFDYFVIYCSLKYVPQASGGNGGRGGHVFIVAKKTYSMNGLNFHSIHFNAQDGTHGGSMKYYH